MLKVFLTWTWIIVHMKFMVKHFVHVIYRRQIFAICFIVLVQIDLYVAFFLHIWALLMNLS